MEEVYKLDKYISPEQLKQVANTICEKSKGVFVPKSKLVELTVTISALESEVANLRLEVEELKSKNSEEEPNNVEENTEG